MLFAWRPEWQPHAGFHELEAGGCRLRFLEVRIPSAHPRLSEPLLVQTYPGRVFLVWNAWHDDLIPWPGQSQEEFIREAVATVERWTSDRQLFARTYRGDQMLREWGGPVDDERVRRSLTERSKPGERTVVWSWRGTHDREF